MGQSDSVGALHPVPLPGSSLGSRRDFLVKGLGVAACLAPASVATAAGTAERASGDGEAEDAAVSAITPTTVEEAEKIHAVRFSVAQRKELATAIPAQVKAVTQLRRVPRPLALQPGLHFDPPASRGALSTAGEHPAAGK